ncbi:YozE family protein [Streptomyces phaeoluteigriseus]
MNISAEEWNARKSRDSGVRGGFRTWLVTTYAGEQSPLGDFAREVRDDDEWPDPQFESLREYLEYLDSLDAGIDTLDLLEEAWDQYKGRAQ